ncbi:class I SAM-dependent methyltransferase [Sinomicrobium weinanense]|uniref:Class I SAM-dependent methyltransferase n=1 Tax=Sinomicrobium weinanense TaxID=2842200 RepID=A0A926JU29_9FLAO|nr:class I SAM-dependent methyltransferase [Sinomicrobium weinanense]MBC9797495.1 class I SAM-dependent methyltransferase [Sinomicrobium weinanense]MBU3122219.1 class I SAM-dependent methyltransferase [Sinomicrobium weinanense]
MAQKISNRLAEIVDALPLKNGIRVLEVGCGTGLAAREIVNRVENGYVLAVDRSPKAIAQATKNAQKEIEKGALKFVQAKIEALELPGEEPFDFAFAIRVGALDGRHPEIEQEALKKISGLLKKNGKLFIDGGNPLRELVPEGFKN